MGIPVKCSNCDELFPDAVSLYEHLRTNHNMASNDAKEMVLEGIKNLREKNAEKQVFLLTRGDLLTVLIVMNYFLRQLPCIHIFVKITT